MQLIYHCVSQYRQYVKKALLFPPHVMNRYNNVKPQIFSVLINFIFIKWKQPTISIFRSIVFLTSIDIEEQGTKVNLKL